MLANDLALTTECERDYYQHDEECRDHYQNIGQNKRAAAEKNA